MSTFHQTGRLKLMGSLFRLLLKRATHGAECRAYKTIGRFGSRSGLLWSKGDAHKCDCGLSQIVAQFVISENDAIGDTKAEKAARPPK